MRGLRADLGDLEQSPSFLMLAADDPGAMTATRLGASGVESVDLWPLLESAGTALAEIRLEVDLHPTDEARARVAGPELARPRVGGPASWPGTHTVAETVVEVRRRLDAVQPLVAEVDELWRSILPRVDAASASLARLRAEMDELGVPEPLIGRAEALAADLRERLVGDPLAVVAADGDRLDALVAEAAGQVARQAAGHESLADDLARAEELLAELRLLRARAVAAGTEARTKVAGDHELVRVPSVAVLDGPGGLAERLDRVLGRPGTGAEGARPALGWNQQRGLLDAWLGQADRLRDQLRRALDANRGPLELRDELRGRLQAYQAKMSAVGRAEDLTLGDVVDQARSTLYTAPTDLDRARDLIDDLARRLRS